MKTRKWSLLLNKASIRKSLLEKRAQVIESERALDALQAKKIFLASDLATHQNYGCYLPLGKEFDSVPLIEALWKAEKQVYLPILLPDREAGMQFSLYTPETKLVLNRYKILEPEHPQFFPAEKLDVVFLPLVGFDLTGNRLGMGAGYYDRTFSFLHDQKIIKPLLVGLAYEFQCVTEISNEEWDVRLNGILTGSDLYQVKRTYK